MDDQPPEIVAGLVGTETEAPRHIMYRCFAQFLRDINWGRSSGELEFAYAIMPLPISSEFAPAPRAAPDFDERAKFIGDTLLAALREEHDSSWMSLAGGRGYDAGGGDFVPGSARSSTFIEYYVHSERRHRPEGIRLYERSNAIVARETFSDRECFAASWLWSLVKPAHRFAGLALRELAPDVTWVATAGVLINDGNVPLRIVDNFGHRTDYVRKDGNQPLVLGDVPLEVRLNDEAAPNRANAEMQAHLYRQYGVPHR